MLFRGKDKTEFFLASLLYDSIEFRHIESVKSHLTEKGADPNLILPKKGIAPFHLAVGCDPPDFAFKVTSLILQNGGNPNVRSDDGLTPVHIAAAWGCTDILRLLLNNGGNPEARDIIGKTPLHYAAAEGYTECLDILKTFLPIKNDLIRRDEDNGDCCLVLDKILVNNGDVIGEYNVADEQHPTDDSINLDQDGHRLQYLPQTDTTEYILNWFTKQRHSAGNSANLVDSIANSLGNNSAFECSNDDGSLVESDCVEEESKRCDPKWITFRKVYKKKRSKSRSSTPPETQDVTVYHDVKNDLFDNSIYVDAITKEFSRESGVVMLTSSLSDSSLFAAPVNTASISKPERSSSDYLTCSQNSINSFEKNVFEITDDNSEKAAKSDKSDEGASDQNSFVSVSEVYKYVDRDQGVVLYERRLLKTSSEYAKSVKSSNVSSNLSSLPPTFDYDTDDLRQQLTGLGFNPGPITVTTKRVYLKKLHQLRKYPAAAKTDATEPKNRVYSVELEKTLRNSQWCNNLEPFKALEEVVVKQFSNPDPTRKWREGVNKSSFTYLLLDPRVTGNLPGRIDALQLLEAWEVFLSAIFYVGKGKRSRPYQHLYDAVDLWKKDQFSSTNKKLHKILDIWKSGCGVICLHVYLSTIPVEAYTREAAMISALKLDNLTNVKSGEFYGVPATWTQRQKKMLGVYLLHKAMVIFLNEGERQLCPTDID